MIENEHENHTGNLEIPVWRKATLTIEEAVAYSGIGRDKLRQMTNKKDCEFVLWVGNKRLIKRRLFEQYLEKTYAVEA